MLRARVCVCVCLLTSMRPLLRRQQCFYPPEVGFASVPLLRTADAPQTEAQGGGRELGAPAAPASRGHVGDLLSACLNVSGKVLKKGNPDHFRSTSHSCSFAVVFQ